MKIQPSLERALRHWELLEAYLRRGEEKTDQ